MAVVIDCGPASAEEEFNIKLKKYGTKYGTSKAYITTRLRRDGYNELADEVEAGTRSANSIAIELGWRKTPSKFARILKWLPELTAAQRRELYQVLALDGP